MACVLVAETALHAAVTSGKVGNNSSRRIDQYEFAHCTRATTRNHRTTALAGGAGQGAGRSVGSGVERARREARIPAAATRRDRARHGARRIGGNVQKFNFGEMTMTRAAVQLLDATVTSLRPALAILLAVRRGAPNSSRCSMRFCRTRRGMTSRRPCGRAACCGTSGDPRGGAAKVMATKVDFFTLVRGE